MKIDDTIKKDVEYFLKDFEDRHSDIQIEYFIVKAQGHPFFQYRQCLREIKARWSTIKDNEKSFVELKKFLELAKDFSLSFIVDHLAFISRRHCLY